MARPIVRTNSTLARLSFFKHGLPAPANRVDAYDELALPSFENQSSLVGFEFTKRLGEPAGSLNVTLKGNKLRGNPLYAGQPWPDLIEEGDWWGLDIIKNGTNQGLSFGRIDSVGVDIQAPMGEGAVVVSVTGRDIGYALSDTPIFFNPHNPALDNALGIQMMTITERAIGTAGQIIPTVIKGFMGGLALNPLAGHHQIPSGMVLGAPVDTSGAVRWVDAVDFVSCVQQLLKGQLLSQPMWTPSPQSLWDYIQAWKNPVLNEVFIDMKPLPGYPKQACLTVREKPFVNTNQGFGSSWYALRTWSIDASMITSMRVNRGGNRINYTSLSGDMLVGLNEETLVSAFLTILNKDSVQKHGLRRLEEYTRYFDDVKNIGQQIQGRAWLNLITEWNALNHEYWQGSISLGEMRVEIRPGDKIAVINGPPAQYGAFPVDGGVKEVALTFYVEAVSHRYMAGERPVATTTLTVSRGFQDSIRPAELAAEVNPLTWTDLLPDSAAVASNVPVQLNTTTELENALIDTEPAFGEHRVESNAELI